MATYGELTLDVRGHTGFTRQQKADKFIARMIWRGLDKVIREAVELNPQDNRLPRATSSVAAPADLTSGFAVPTNLKLLTVEARYDSGARSELNVVPEYARWGTIHPKPAAYIQNATLYPIPAVANTAWTHATISSLGEWSDVASVVFEYVAPPSAPTSMGGTVPNDDLFHDAAVWWAAFCCSKNPNDLMMYEREKEKVLGSIGRIQPAGSEAVVDVRG